MFADWMIGGWDTVWLVLLTGGGAFVAIVAMVRLSGLRSFSKMSATDFVITVALGSILASMVVAQKPSLLVATSAIGALLGIKWFAAWGRRHVSGFSRVLENEPVYLMRGGEFIESNLDSTQVTRDDVHAKLREANVWNYKQVIAVVLETTGDVAVLHRPGPDLTPDAEIFKDVVGDAPVNR